MSDRPIKSRSERAGAAFPSGRVGFAVGDIHGRADLLDRTLTRLEQELPHSGEQRPVLVFLGDYVYRGPDSAAVIDLLLERTQTRFEAHFHKGNHEAAMLAFMEDPIAHRAGWRTAASIPLRPTGCGPCRG